MFKREEDNHRLVSWNTMVRILVTITNTPSVFCFVFTDISQVEQHTYILQTSYIEIIKRGITFLVVKVFL